jgi:mono/diheme cytochrome c family protein
MKQNILYALSILLVMAISNSSCEFTDKKNPLAVGQTTNPDSLPRIAIPKDVDTSSPYWSGIDLSPKMPVQPLTVAQQKSRFLLPEGYTMEAVLTEPKIQQPAQIIFDGNGRMYVLELRTYMLNLNSENTLTPKSVISRWEDRNNDGVYETGTDFVSGLIFPRFVLPYGPNAVLSMESNDDVVYKYIDDNGDGKSDRKEFFTDKFGRSGNVEHQQAFLYWGMDNWLYSTVNPFRIRETSKGIVKREPTGSNKAQWGITHDDDGKLWFQGGSNGVPTIFQFPIHYGDYEVADSIMYEDGFRIPHGAPIGIADMQGGMRAVRKTKGNLNGVTGSSGNDIFRGDRLPKELYGEYFYGEPVARIVRRIKADKKEGIITLKNHYQNDSSEFIRSTDPLFRPVDMATAPDGTMYICDMYHGIIQEGQWTPEGSYLRTKIQQYQLDKVIGLGRIWRLVHKDHKRDASKIKMYDEKTVDLVKHLSHPNGWWRDMAQQVIVQRGDKSIVPQLQKTATTSTNINARFHALWCLEGLKSLDGQLVRKLLQDPNPRMRIMAMYAGESVYKSGDLLLAEDFMSMVKDKDNEVAMRAMMTLRLFNIKGKEDVVKKKMAVSKSAGIQLVGSQVLKPPVVTSFFGRADKKYTPEENAMLEQGAKIYNDLCSTCHGNTGLGTPMGRGALMAPSLVGNKHVQMHPEYTIKTVLRGLSGKIDEQNYPGGMMASMAANDDKWIAAVVSFIRSNFENESSLVTADQVASLRKATAQHTKAYTFDELIKSIPKEIPYSPKWKVTASHTGPTRPGSNAVPKGAFTFEGWTSGKPQEKGMWYAVELPEAHKITQIEFNSEGHRLGKFPKFTYVPSSPMVYSINTSQNGAKWTTIHQGITKGGKSIITFEPMITKYLKIELTGPDTVYAAPWNMTKLKLYEK